MDDTCPNCGTELEDAEAGCQRCGAVLCYCTNAACGEVYLVQQVNCRHCGEENFDFQAPPEGEPEAVSGTSALQAFGLLSPPQAPW